MKIKEVEELTGITAQNIRFYEKKGLLTPERENNMYRQYTNNDILHLKQIKLLRLLGVPISDILLVRDGEVSFARLLEVHGNAIAKKQEEFRHINKICKQIRKESTTFGGLNPDKYLDEIEVQNTLGIQFFKIVEDFKEKICHYLPPNPSFIIEPKEPVMNKYDFTMEILRYCEDKDKKVFILKESMIPTVEIDGVRYRCQLELPHYLNLPFPFSAFFYVTKTFGYRFISVYKYDDTIYEVDEIESGERLEDE